VIICLVALISAAVAGFLVWRDRPQPRAVSAIVPQAASMVSGVASSTGPTSAVAATSSARPTASSGAASGIEVGAGASAPPTSVPPSSPGPAPAGPSVIIVSVTGMVKHPGLVRLSAGARVADAIKAAGGVVGVGDLTGMNLAAKLTDGASVVVGPVGGGSITAPAVAPTIGPASTTDAASGAAGPHGDGSSAPSTQGQTPATIDLNTADTTALDALPGVGPVTAAAIVAYREQHGPFTSVDQLQAIAGIGPARFAQIAPHVTVGGAPP
jgi:competence protein ComEA